MESCPRPVWFLPIPYPGGDAVCFQQPGPRGRTWLSFWHTDRETFFPPAPRANLREPLQDFRSRSHFPLLIGALATSCPKVSALGLMSPMYVKPTLPSILPHHWPMPPSSEPAHGQASSQQQRPVAGFWLLHGSREKQQLAGDVLS